MAQNHRRTQTKHRKATKGQGCTKLGRIEPMGGTLVIYGWGCAAGTLEPLAYTRASSAEFCYPMLEFLKSLLS